jgi:gluconolactonase
MRRITCLVIGIGSFWFAAVGRAEDHADLPPSHSVRPELYATNIKHAEGPALDTAGNLFMLNYERLGTIGRVTPDGRATIYCDLLQQFPAKTRQAMPNGLKVDRQGRLIVADMGGGRVLRVTPSPVGKPPAVELLADKFEGTPLLGPNDIALDRVGNIYFTDPGSSNSEHPYGAVYRIDGKNRKVTRLDSGLAYPNGLVISIDQKHFFLDESAPNRVLMYDLTPDGRLVNRRTLIDFPRKTEGNIVGGPFGADGMILDAAGRLFVAECGGGVIDVVEVPSGKLIRQYDVGGAGSTNCHFYNGHLYATANGSVFRLKLGVEGFDYNRAP